MRLHPLPSSPTLLRELLNETGAYLSHYTPLLAQYRSVIDDARAGKALDETQHCRFLDRLTQGGPGLIKSAKYLDYPFGWAGDEAFSSEQERWLEELRQSPDAPWTAAAAVAALVYLLQNDLLERLAELDSPPKKEPEWLVGSRRQLNRALGVSEGYSDYLEKQQEEGSLRLERRGKKYAIQILDPEAYQRARVKLAQLRGE